LVLAAAQTVRTKKIEQRNHRAVQQKHRRPAVVRLLARNGDRTSSAAKSKDRVETGTSNNTKHKRRTDHRTSQGVNGAAIKIEKIQIRQDELNEKRSYLEK
jgi:hypothetical protein